jgi:AraC-like DNA-binding protein
LSGRVPEREIDLRGLYRKWVGIFLQLWDRNLYKSVNMATEELWIDIPFAVNDRPHLKRVLNGIEAYARKQRNWRLRLEHYYKMTPLPELGGKTHGAIAGVPTRGHLDSIQKRNVPTVLINCPPACPDWASNVEFDFDELGELAVGHYHKQGFAALGWFGSLHPERSEHWRYFEAVKRHAEAMEMELIAFDTPPPDLRWHDVHAQRDQWVEWVRHLPEGIGVICADDEYAARLYGAGYLAERPIGKDLYVLGMGNEEFFCEAQSPPMSSIQVDYFRLGWEASVILDRLLEDGGGEQARKQIGSASVITRQSSRPHSHAHSRVDAAMKLIWDNVGEGITVEAVARHVHLERRQLHRLFMEETGRSPSDEIQRARLETAKRMLCERSDPIAEIATACGYFDQAHMARSIKQATGSTPSQFRLIGRRG